jgi:hypothetical protein
MKQALRKGGPADLNIYVTQLNNGGIIGCAAPSPVISAARACTEC